MSAQTVHQAMTAAFASSVSVAVAQLPEAERESFLTNLDDAARLLALFPKYSADPERVREGLAILVARTRDEVAAVDVAPD